MSPAKFGRILAIVRHWLGVSAASTAG